MRSVWLSRLLFVHPARRDVRDMQHGGDWEICIFFAMPGSAQIEPISPTRCSSDWLGLEPIGSTQLVKTANNKSSLFLQQFIIVFVDNESFH